MKINLHCHSNYSDGADIFKMAEEHKKQGFSAFVVTDHVYPMVLYKDKTNSYSRSITSYEKYQNQSKDLNIISKRLDYPCIQGIELALYGEEVLVFGNKAIKEIFDYMSKLDLAEQEKYGDTTQYKNKMAKNLLDILETNKEDTAIILCHPHLVDTPEWVIEPLYKIVDGYEFQNGRTYYFKDETNKDIALCWNRDIPDGLKAKKKFYNSDAHYASAISNSEGNYHTNKIMDLDDLISYIKTPEKQNQNSIYHKNLKSR